MRPYRQNPHRSSPKAEQLREGELGRQHWYHEKLYRRLTEVAAALGEAYPGGMGHLQRNASRRSR